MSETTTIDSSKNGATVTAERTRIQLLREQAKQLQEEIAAENQRLEEVRAKKKERTHVMVLLGSICERQGKEAIQKMVQVSGWLKPEDRDAIEYYFELKPRPVVEKKSRKKAAEKTP